MIKAKASALVFVITLVFSFSSAFAVDLSPEQEAKAEDLFGSLLSPFCPGRLISDCPSGKASELKERIRTELSSGRSIEAVRQELYTEFGEDSLRPTPKDEGFGLVGWLLPAIFFLVGGVILTKWLSNMKVPTIPVGSKHSFDPALEERIRKDLEDI